MKPIKITEKMLKAGKLEWEAIDWDGDVPSEEYISKIFLAMIEAAQEDISRLT